MKIDETTIKVKAPHESRDGFHIYPFNMLENTPPRDCVFDSYHGTIGFDVFPFSVTTRINSSNQIFLKIYEDMDDPVKGKGHEVTARNRANGEPNELARPLTTDEWDNMLLTEYEKQETDADSGEGC